MSKFNQTTIGENKTTNICGAPAYKMQDKEKIVTMVPTSLFGEKKFYGDNTNETVSFVKQLIQNGEGKFISNLAIFARK